MNTILKRLFFTTSLLFLFVDLSAQLNLPQITPLSPNAASISKYGEIPVGHFTGTPNIGIPLYTIKSNELSLPLSLIYHAGGNKVESIASWVGLGWSLGSIPSISRNVRGLPDENGFYTRYNDKTVQEILNLDPSNGIHQNFRNGLFSGTVDSEPDIFYYNLPDESGKFFYDQESETFVTYPKSNIIIERDELNSFRLTSQNGIQYIFNIQEKTTSQGSVQHDPVNSTWYASKMISPSKKDSIRFTYLDEDQVTKTRNVIIKYHYLAGLTNGFPSNEGSIIFRNDTDAKVIDSIIFTNGYVRFNKNTNERQDLQGGYSLNNISIYNKYDQLISKYEFGYRYKQGTGSACIQDDDHSHEWMLLDKVEQVSTNSSDKLLHKFTYNESYFPCRTSAAQDYWGYYNGQDSNVDLTPAYYIPGTNPQAQISGANREVNSSKSDFGILTKIEYPTGGYTEFDFENNMARGEDIPPQYIEDGEMLTGDELIDWDSPIPESDIFTEEFTLNNPPDLVLNNNNPMGGAYVSFKFFNPGCDLSSGQANNCALFTVSGPSINTTDITIYGKTLYLPNGTYTMTASFNQPFPDTNYQDFIFMAEWEKIGTNQSGNVYIGGLRIKEIRSYTNSLAHPITKKYKYTKSYNSTESSGDIYSDPNFSHQDVITYTNDVLPQDGVTGSILLRVRSVSNVQQVTHSGSPVGYKTVYEETDDPNETGYIEYQFSHSRDISNNVFPYPPTECMELSRGQIREQMYYKESGGSFDLVQKKSFTYGSPTFIESNHPKYSFGVKWGNRSISERTFGQNINYAEYLIGYKVNVGWINLSRETVKSYYDNDSIKAVTDHSYDNQAHLLRTTTEIINSDGQRIITNIKYPQDIASPTAAIDSLIKQNRLAELIETETIKNNQKQKQVTVYKDWGNSLILPEFIQTSKGTGDLKDRIIYHNYDDKGNPTEVGKRDGTHMYYVWGYNGQYPIAKIENAKTADFTIDQNNKITAAINASDIDSTDVTENTLRDKLEDIRVAFPNAMVTTYTYDPLIGVTSINDPKSYSTYYEYDGFNRLIQIKDAEGKIVSQNEYHYKGQQ